MEHFISNPPRTSFDRSFALPNISGIWSTRNTLNVYRSLPNGSMDLNGVFCKLSACKVWPCHNVPWKCGKSCVCVCQCPQIASNARSFLLRSRYTGLSGLKEAVQVAQLPCCIGLATSYMPLLDLTTKRWDFLMHHSTSRNHNGINILGVLHLGQMGHWHTCIIISEASFLLDYSRTMN